ncbi:interferon-induced protein 44-like isoform X2 [Chiloscyllium plagiosum]|uniref:interferon-induced protein 44-like isoform X2 n=1 Tax=Chiloscyllium plagiosum TaxID=36176 RepID=UPI001CB802EE|nr:interferon-induced protein 44-like isoform X2 [Chiloscyllium plagiosum]
MGSSASSDSDQSVNCSRSEVQDESLTDPFRLDGDSQSNWWKVSTDSEDSSENNDASLDEYIEDLQMTYSILHIKPQDLTEMGVRVIPENIVSEDSSWGEDSTDSEVSLEDFSKQKHPRYHVVRRLTSNHSVLEALRCHLSTYNPPTKCGHCINILLVGLVGAGKSATINTFLSALNPSRRTISCVPTGVHPDSITTKLKSYKSNSLQFWDTAGWDSLKDVDKRKELLTMILEGRVPPGTVLQDFNPHSDGAQNPVIPENVIHAVAFIFNIFTMEGINMDLMKQFQELQTIVSQKGIYNIVIGNNFDRLRIPQKSYNRIYENRKLKRKFAMLSDYTGMKKRTMFAISNEWKGDKIEKTKCILALYALKNIVKNIDPSIKLKRQNTAEAGNLK